MSGAGAPWLLLRHRCGYRHPAHTFHVSALAFALGMFIPLELNLLLLVGGLINWYVTTRSNKEQTNKERGEKGTLIASGFIAGGALMGVVSAALRFGELVRLFRLWAIRQRLALPADVCPPYYIYDKGKQAHQEMTEKRKNA